MRVKSIVGSGRSEGNYFACMTHISQRPLPKCQTSRLSQPQKKDLYLLLRFSFFSQKFCMILLWKGIYRQNRVSDLLSPRAQISMQTGLFVLQVPVHVILKSNIGSEVVTRNGIEFYLVNIAGFAWGFTSGSAQTNPK